MDYHCGGAGDSSGSDGDPEEDVVLTMRDVAASDTSEEELAQWLKQYSYQE